MFPTNKRLSREIIKKAISNGSKYYSELFLIKYIDNDLDTSRFAVVVSKKVSKSAVGRHLVKRRFVNVLNNMKEINIKDYVILVSPKSKIALYEEIKEELVNGMASISNE